MPPPSDLAIRTHFLLRQVGCYGAYSYPPPLQDDNRYVNRHELIRLGREGSSHRRGGDQRQQLGEKAAAVAGMSMWRELMAPTGRCSFLRGYAHLECHMNSAPVFRIRHHSPAWLC